MATKTISITTEAYDILKSWKEGNDSFSEAITRRGRKQNLLRFAGILSDESADSLERSVQEGRLLSRARAERIKREFDDS
ncbi:antitoxin VapB family protein [Candidatus Woesearchaeota archaeon]|nr:antitoxin VapB family protein [Candidatus Woesearchaeota archaeon]